MSAGVLIAGDGLTCSEVASKAPLPCVAVRLRAAGAASHLSRGAFRRIFLTCYTSIPVRTCTWQGWHVVTMASLSSKTAWFTC